MTALLFPRLAFADDRVALRTPEGALTYRELQQAAGAHAARLAARGIAPGDPVAVWATPTLPTLIAVVGQLLGGYVTVPLNPKLGRRELDHILGDASPKVVFADDPDAFPATPSALRIERGAADPPARVVDDEGALLLYTSGTTGAPKGAVITARNIASNLDGLADAWGWTDADTVVHALPLFHVHGLVLGALGSLRVGGALSHLGSFDPSRVANALAGEGTMLFSVPTMVHRLADAAEADAEIARGLQQARLLISGSAGLPVREHRRIEAITGRGVHERYGLTETLINCAVRAHGSPQPGYVGLPLRGVELRLVDDDRNTVEGSDDETIAEVAVRGASVFAGYLGRPDATAAVHDDDGWFYTGDLATRRSDGAIRIVGRRSVDLIKTGGFKVGAGEVEACLLEHPGVREVAVVGVPDDDLGERIAAFVVPRDAAAPPASQELCDRVASDLTPHKRPREVHFVEALPRNAMGKVQKKRLQRP
ncbi:MAG: AMP-binding protein [Myxococcota bacterium]